MMKMVKDLISKGKKPKEAIAMALASARKSKMSEGGMVDDDLDQEHERSLESLMIQGDQPPVASPDTQDMQKELAAKLQRLEDDEEYYADGGLVEGVSGDEEPDVKVDGAEHSEEMPMEQEEMKSSDSVMIDASDLPDHVMQALLESKKRRKFRG